MLPFLVNHLRLSWLKTNKTAHNFCLHKVDHYTIQTLFLPSAGLYGKIPVRELLKKHDYFDISNCFFADEAPSFKVKEIDCRKLPLHYQNIIAKLVAHNRPIKNPLHFFDRHWDLPDFHDVFEVAQISKSVAWTLIHGNSIHHCTYLLPDLCKKYVEMVKTINLHPLLETELGVKTATKVQLDAFAGGKWESSYCEVVDYSLKDRLAFQTIE